MLKKPKLWISCVVDERREMLGAVARRGMERGMGDLGIRVGREEGGWGRGGSLLVVGKGGRGGLREKVRGMGEEGEESAISRRGD